MRPSSEALLVTRITPIRSKVSPKYLTTNSKRRERAIIFQDIIDTQGHTWIGEKELGDICYKYGNYLRSKSKYETAVRIAQREKENAEITPFERRKLDNQILYAKIHAAMADYQNGGSVQAQEQIDALAAAHPDHPLIAYGRGQMALLKGDVETAIATFETTIEKDPASDAAPVALGEYYLSQEKPDAAIERVGRSAQDLSTKPRSPPSS